MKYAFFILCFALVQVSCSHIKKTTDVTKSNRSIITQSKLGESFSLRKVMVFKPTSDIQHLVPISLSTDKTQIIAYPAPADLPEQSIQQLSNGYMLDLVGVNANTAYLDITIQAYKAKNQTLSLTEMKEHITFLNPFSELYECSYTLIQSKDISTLNNWISEGVLSQKCKVIPVTSE